MTCAYFNGIGSRRAPGIRRSALVPAGLVGGFSATASVWKSRFCSWVETLAYPIGIAPAPRRSFPIPAGASLTNSRRAGQW